MWLSLVEYYVRDVGAAGSNPVTSTTKNPQSEILLGLRIFLCELNGNDIKRYPLFIVVYAILAVFLFN